MPRRELTTACLTCGRLLAGPVEKHWRGPVITIRTADGIPHRDLSGLRAYCKACAERIDREGVAY